MQQLFSDHGVGVGLRPDHYALFSDRIPKSVNWVEVISENFLPWKGHDYFRPFHRLSIIRKDVPVALHGVSLSIGSTDDLDMDYLKLLKDLKNKIQPIWFSDHLCWTGVNGENLHDLLPLPYTKEAIKHVVERISRVQDFMGERMLIENLSSYVDFNISEMTEWEFVAEIANQADCGILLDVNNVYVSSINHNFDAKKYIDHIPGHRIGQIHLAGHSVEDGYLIDTHDAPVCKEVWDLYNYTLKQKGTFSSMIERDGKIPEWEALEAELLQAHSIYNSVKCPITKNHKAIDEITAL
jgi:uncharacterized protein